MPRPRKCRRVCNLPRHTDFIPLGAADNNKKIILTVDEYEAVRLIDKVGLSQEECGQYMNIARTTVQQIYTNARKKIADALVDGLALKIEGGDYCLCDGSGGYSGCGGCMRKRCYCDKAVKAEGEKIMKTAIPMDENKVDVCVSFARAPYFMIVDENGESEIKVNPAADAQGGAGVKAAQFVVDCGADSIITVRCGENAAEVIKEADIKIYKSSAVNAMENVNMLKEGKLEELTHFHAGFHGIK